MSKKFVSAVIVAAGLGKRFGGDKIFSDLGGKPVLAHSLLAFEGCEAINEIIVVTTAENIEKAAALAAEFKISKLSGVIEGGSARSDSVRAGVLSVSKKADYIAVHDGARPLITRDVITRTIDKAKKYHAAIAAVNVKSTVKICSSGQITETPKRDRVYEAQTPQIFDADLLLAAVSNYPNASFTDESALIESLGVTVHIAEGDYRNIKITTPEDLIVAKALLQEARI